MMIRVPETHVCPEATKEAKAIPLTADVRSASLNTMIGAFKRHIRRLCIPENFFVSITLPPSSAVNAAKLEPTMLPRARPVDVPACTVSDGHFWTSYYTPTVMSTFRTAG
jgi:hypothetical protein